MLTPLRQHGCIASIWQRLELVNPFIGNVCRGLFCGIYYLPGGFKHAGCDTDAQGWLASDKSRSSSNFGCECGCFLCIHMCCKPQNSIFICQSAILCLWSCPDWDDLPRNMGMIWPEWRPWVGMISLKQPMIPVIICPETWAFLAIKSFGALEKSWKCGSNNPPAS